MKRKRILSVALLSLSLISCNHKTNADRNAEQVDSGGNWTGDLNIGIFTGGFGTQYLQNVADGFHEKNPGVNVKIISYADRSKISTDLQSSDELQNNDIYLIESNDIFKAANIDDAFPTSGHKEALVELSDVYDTINDGEQVAVKDKISTDFLNYCTNQWGDRIDKRYMMSYGITVSGVAYNHTIVDKYLTNNVLPRTTDEFYDLCQKIQSGETKKGFSAIVYAAGNSAKLYWNEPYYAWWAQYNGTDKFKHFFQGRALDEESGQWVQSRDIFSLSGRREAFKVSSKFLAKANGLTNPNTMISFTHFQAQTQLLSDNSAFMMNSGWLENEMTTEMYKDDDTITGKLGMMRYPIISSITDNCKTINDDSTLAQVVQNIDDNKTYEQRDEVLKDVSQVDYQTIYDARHIVKADSTVNFAAVPTSAKNKTLAKKFLAYMYSDDGIKRYLSATPGCFLPIKNFDYDTVDAIKNTNSNFVKDCVSMMKENNFIWPYANNSIVYNGGLNGVFLDNDNSLEINFGGNNPITPDAAYNRLIDYYHANERYDELMAKADK